MTTQADTPLTIAVLGAGLIGQRHVALVQAEAGARLHALVDPDPATRAFAQTRGADWFEDFAAMLERAGRPDAVIIATPNQTHVALGLEAVAARLPMLVEKPVADTVASGRALVDAAEAAGVPILVGHHRRHNSLIRRARAMIEEGRLGPLVAVHGVFWLKKPDEYFDHAWRREPGAGPLLINCIHDVDLLRHLCGEIVEVQAMASNAHRGFAVEDTAAILMRFANGALGTFALTDCAVAPWSWEQTAGENPAYPRSGETCYFIAGARGALALPHLDLWTNPERQGWFEPLRRERVMATQDDPLTLQLRHFVDVARGRAAPLVSGREALKTLQTIEAIRHAAETGARVAVAQ